MALQLAQDGGRGVTRELRPAVGLEAVDGLDQAEARDLEQVVEGLVGVRVAEREVARQREEALYELLTRGEVSVCVVAHQQQALGLARVLAGTGCPGVVPHHARNRNCRSGHWSDLPVVVMTVRSVAQPLSATVPRPPSRSISLQVGY